MAVQNSGDVRLPERGRVVLNPLQMALQASKAKPGIKYAVHRNGRDVGAWDDKLGHWCVVASICPVYKGIYPVPGEFEWVFPNHELYIDNKPTHVDSDWVEVKLKEE